MRSNTCVLEQHDSECIDLILLVSGTSLTKQQHNFNYQRLQQRITPPPPPSSPLLPKKEFNSIDLSTLDKQLYLDNNVQQKNEALNFINSNNNNYNNINNNINIRKDNNDCDDIINSKSEKDYDDNDDNTNDSDVNNNNVSNNLKRFKKVNHIKKKLININSILVSNVSPINQ
ncbi:hypothetical protein ACTFIV_009271 [Dictyostelium citrinum]